MLLGCLVKLEHSLETAKKFKYRHTTEIKYVLQNKFLKVLFYFWFYGFPTKSNRNIKYITSWFLFYFFFYNFVFPIYYRESALL